jgi:membrane associated rhomboid family serine protease
MPGTAALAGGSVITEAHLYGAVGGLLAGSVILALHRLRPIRR